MKGKSKILALLIIMMLVLSMGLVACNRSEDGKPDDGAKPAPITWSEWSVTSIPTADKVGEAVRTNSMGAVEKYELPVLTSDVYKVTEIILPSCAVVGESKYEVTIGDKTISFLVNIVSDGHVWGDATYAWSEDGKTCRATRVCTVSTSHVEIIDATITSEVVVEPTCLTKGKTKYTATFNEEWASVQTNVVEDIDALGHDFGAVTYEWTGIESCTAKRVCKRDASHVEKATATITSEMTKAPTFDTKGETTYTATFDKEWAGTDSKVVVDIDIYTLSKVEAVAPTVNSTGNIEYYKGTDGKYYDDANRSNEITLESTVVAKIAVTKADKIDATYGVNGQREHYYETENSAKKYIKDASGAYVAIKSASELVIPELSGTVSIYFNGAATDKTITHLKSEDIVSDDIFKLFEGNAITGVKVYKDADTAVLMNDADITAYAKANKDITLYVNALYAVTFDNAGTLNIEDREYNATLGTMADGSLSGNVFNGWYHANGDLATSADKVTGAMTLTAQFYDAGLAFNYIDGDETKDIVLTKYTGTASTLVIPDHIFAMGNKSVVEIGDSAFFDMEAGGGPSISSYKAAPTGITSITLPSTIVKIGASAFTGLKLETLALPSGLKYIGDGAFTYMTELKELVIPNSIEFIGYDIAPACYLLEYITIENGGNNLYVSSVDGVSFGGIMYVGKEAIPARENAIIGTIPAVEPYDYIIGATKSTVPSGTKRIYSGAFNEVESVGVNIPASVVEIMSTAFTDSNTSIVTFEDGNEPLVIRNQAFYDNNLTEVILPTRISNIETKAFESNLGLKIYLANDRMPNYDAGWNNYDATTKYDTYITSETRLVNDEIKAWKLDADGNKIIHDIPQLSMNADAILKYNKLDGITAEDIVVPLKYYSHDTTTVSDNAFYGASDIHSITFAKDSALTNIGVTAFANMTNIDYIMLPGTITSVSNDAFDNTDVAIYFYSVPSPEVLANSAFNGKRVYIYSETNQNILLNNTVGYWHYDESNNLQLWEKPAEYFSVRTIVGSPIGEMEITGYVGSNASPVFPTKYLDNNITAIADNAFKNNGTIKTLTVPSTYNRIGVSAFQDSMVDNIVFEEKLSLQNSIDKYAFAGTKITRLSIPNKTVLADYSFANCLSLESVELLYADSSDNEFAFIGSTNIKTIQGNARLLAFDFDWGDIDLVELTTGEISGVSMDAHVKMLKIGKDVSIHGENYIILNCIVDKILIDDANETLTSKNDEGEEISSIIGKVNHVLYVGNNNGDIPLSVTKINGYAFYKRTLSSVYIGNNITAIGMSAFANCLSLTTINFAKSKENADKLGEDWKKDILDGILNGTITINYNVINIIESDPTFNYYVEGNAAHIVAYKGAGKAVTVPSTMGGYNVIGIGETFKGNTSIESVVLGEHIAVISDNSFDGCSALTSIDLMNVTEIASYALSNTGLTSIDLKKVSNIGNNAFAGTHLTSLNLKGVKTIGEMAFQNNAITSLDVPYTVESIGNYAFSYTTSTGTDTIKSLTFLTDAGGRTNLKTIGEGAFSSAHITSLVLPEGIVKIGHMAFKNAHVSTINIPRSVKELGGSIFSELVDTLTSITVDPNNTEYTSRDNNGKEVNAIIYKGAKALYGGMNENYTTNYIVLGCVNTEIPDTVAGIASIAFAGSGIKSIKLGANVEHIGGYAFYNCPELTSVDLGDTKVASIGRYAFGDSPKLSKAILPATVTQILPYAFNTQNMTIYLRGPETDFGGIWYEKNRNISVVWNYKGV